jgi:hypothetical protein
MSSICTISNCSIERGTAVSEAITLGRGTAVSEAVAVGGMVGGTVEVGNSVAVGNWGEVVLVGRGVETASSAVGEGV